MVQSDKAVCGGDDISKVFDDAVSKGIKEPVIFYVLELGQGFVYSNFLNQKLFK